MGDKITLDLQTREVQGKKVASLRKQGLTPAVVYGPGVTPVNVQADHRLIEKVVKEAGYHTPVHITVGSKKRIAMIKDVDISPAKNTIQHVSFHAIRQNEPVVAEVPIVLEGEGESEAERNGLIVLQALEELEVRALPMELPESLIADIRELKEAGEKILVGDIKLPAGVEIVDNESGHGQKSDDDEEDANQHRITDLVVASVYEPSALQAANESAAGDAEEGDEVESDNGSEEANESADKSDAESESKE